VITPIILPWPLQISLEAMARVLLEPGDRAHIDFSRPVGDCSWQGRPKLPRPCRYADFGALEN
jgi:hypothetical protein